MARDFTIGSVAAAEALFVAALFVAATVGPAVADEQKRTYYIAAEEVEWDYAPEGRDLMMGEAFSEDDLVFVGEGPGRIGHIYHKARYIGYTDDSFTTPLPVEDPSRGILGPIIHAEVGDTIDVVYQNRTSVPTSVHPHGVFYDKGSEGSMTFDGTSMDQMADDFVPPGGTYTYHWSVPERAGPGPNDPSSIVWLYHSHVDEVRDTNTGLIGAIVVTAKGMAEPDGTPTDVDREFFTLFSVLNENQSLFLPQMMEKVSAMSRGTEGTAEALSEEDFEESNLMHAINGYVFSNLPMPAMKVGERVRWHVLALGTEVDLHTPHWHGNTVLVGGHRKDVVDLLPATTLVADMVPDNPGIWMFHCHVNDHIAAGMTSRYEVTQ